MNPYGEMAMEFARLHRPAAYAQLKDPEAFFDRAGVEITREVTALAAQLTAGRSGGEPMSGGQARKVAEELVLADHWLRVPEPEASEEEPAAGQDPLLDEHYRDLAAIRAATSPDW